MPDRALIKANLKNTVTESDFKGFKKLHVGKVRDTYEKPAPSGAEGMAKELS